MPLGWDFITSREGTVQRLLKICQKQSQLIRTIEKQRDEAIDGWKKSLERENAYRAMCEAKK
jgi:hypothetical protein